MMGKFASAQREKKKEEKKSQWNFRNCERQFWKRQMSGQRCGRNTH